MATEKNYETLESLKSCIRSQVALGAKAEKNTEKGENCHLCWPKHSPLKQLLCKLCGELWTMSRPTSIAPPRMQALLPPG